ncbi:ECF transporter S component [Thalassotalea crassostreae]|uniref:ECF transporter S component n=1 Tax=Thalassotalea crassostreae TaxID=1763536 RepID=UPI0008383055|nr:ECF transporter S component [Thalassotalea crassostreae]
MSKKIVIILGILGIAPLVWEEVSFFLYLQAEGIGLAEHFEYLEWYAWILHASLPIACFALIATIVGTSMNVARNIWVGAGVLGLVFWSKAIIDDGFYPFYSIFIFANILFVVTAYCAHKVHVASINNSQKLYHSEDSQSATNKKLEYISIAIAVLAICYPTWYSWGILDDSNFDIIELIEGLKAAFWLPILISVISLYSLVQVKLKNSVSQARILWNINGALALTFVGWALSMYSIREKTFFMFASVGVLFFIAAFIAKKAEGNSFLSGEQDKISSQNSINSNSMNSRVEPQHLESNLIQGTKSNTKKLQFDNLPDKDVLQTFLSSNIEARVQDGWGVHKSLLVVRQNGKAVRIRFTNKNELTFHPEMSSQGKMAIAVIIPIIGWIMLISTIFSRENKVYASGLLSLVENSFDKQGNLVKGTTQDTVQSPDVKSTQRVSITVLTEDEQVKVEGYQGQAFNTSIGCSDKADIFIADPMLEEHQADLHFDGNDWYVVNKTQEDNIKFRAASSNSEWREIEAHQLLKVKDNIELSLSGCEIGLKLGTV